MFDVYITVAVMFVLAGSHTQGLTFVVWLLVGATWPVTVPLWAVLMVMGAKGGEV